MKYMNNRYGISKVFGKKGINLQLFAEDEDEDEEDDEEIEEEDSEEEDKPEKKKERLYSKKELGAIVAREVKKAQESAAAEKSEAEKLENMTAEQKRQYEQQQKDKEIEELKRKVTRMEMSDTAAKLLKDADIIVTPDILDFVVGEDAETTSKNIEKFKAIKDAIVLAAEKARNTGKTPKIATGTEKKTDKKLSEMGYTELLKLKNEDPEGYKKVMEERK